MVPGVEAGELSPLAPKPNWSTLNAYQKTITRKEFTRLINQYYSPKGDFWNYAKIDDEKVEIYAKAGTPPNKGPAGALSPGAALQGGETSAWKFTGPPLFTLRLASSDAAAAPLPYPYKTKAVSTDPARPLKGLRIALDPGHIGGEWAQLEARYFKLGDDPSVEESKLNMITCERIADLLRADGAEIVWAKHSYDPVTSLRPDSLHREAIAALAKRPGTTKKISDESAIERMIDNEAALLFYRVAEIRARAALVNKLKPDLTICVHYNADDWGDPNNPKLVGHSRLVIFANGSYDANELVFDDQKYDLMRKLLDRTAVQESRGCALVGQSMIDVLKYPPEIYPGGYSARHITNVPSVYTRNLIANRLYHGPVIYCEGPYMNSPDAYYRIIAGDYLGYKTIRGEKVRSVYREYAEGVEQGVLKYFGVK